MPPLKIKLFIYLCMYVCVYVCIHARMHASIYLSIYLSIHPSIHPSIHLMKYINLNICIYASIDMNVTTHTTLSTRRCWSMPARPISNWARGVCVCVVCACACACVCVCVCVYVYVSVSVSVCLCVRICENVSMYIPTCTYTFIGGCSTFIRSDCLFLTCFSSTRPCQSTRSPRN